MIQISKDEAYLVRRIYPSAPITPTRHNRFLAEEERYLKLLSEHGSSNADDALEEIESLKKYLIERQGFEEKA